MDRSGHKWTKWNEVDRMDKIEPKWTKVGQNGPIRTKVDQIRLLSIYHFYCIFRAHISNL